MKKLSHISIVLVFSLFLAIVSSRSVQSEAYIENTIEGSVDTNSSDVYFLSLNQKGNTVLLLEWNHGQPTDAIIQLELFDGTGLVKVKEEELGKNGKIHIIEVNDLGPKGFIDIKVRVHAMAGSSAYRITVLRPNEIKSARFFSSYIIMPMKITESNPDGLQLLWNNLTESLSSVKVKLFKAGQSVEEVFNTKDPEGKYGYYPPGQIQIPSLLPGDYVLILEKKGDDDGEIMTKTVQSLDFPQIFLKKNLTGKQYDRFVINVTGQDKFLWLIWGKASGLQQHPSVTVKMFDPNGNTIFFNEKTFIALDANGVGLIPLTGMVPGEYLLQVSSQDSEAIYYLGYENMNSTFRALSYTAYQVLGELSGAAQTTYDFKANEGGTRKIIVEFTNTGKVPALVEFGLEPGGKKTGIRTIESGQNMHVELEHTFIQNQKYSIWIKTSAGHVMYQVNTNQNKMIAFEPHVSDIIVGFSTELTYYSGHTSADWSKVTFASDESPKNTLRYTGNFTLTKPTRTVVVQLKDYYNLESIPLSAKRKVPDGKGGMRTEDVKVVKWELIPVSGISKYNDPNNKQLLVDVNFPTIRNKLGIFQVNNVIGSKVEVDSPRIMVNWIVPDSATSGVVVGTLKGTTVLGEEFTTELKVYPIDRSKPGEKDWNDFAFEIIHEIRDKGILVERNSSKKVPYTLKTDIPLHLVEAKIVTESGYRDQAVRYEPFWDMWHFYLEGEPDRTLIRQMKQAKESVGYISSGLTIYQYFTKYRSNYNPPTTKTWYKTPLNAYLDLRDNKKRLSTAEWYLHIYLDYGCYAGAYFYKKATIDKYTDDQLKFMDATTTDYTNDIWKYIKTATVYNGETRVTVTVNPNAADDLYPIQFSKPSANQTDIRWDKRWQEPEVQILSSDSNNTKEAKEKENARVRSDNNKFKTYVTEIVLSILHSKKAKDKEIYRNILKEFLELYIKYEHKRVFEWYEKGRANPQFNWYGNSNPKQILPTPFIAQTVISSSYGPSQIMFVTAWEYGYRYHPNKNPNKEDYMYSLRSYQTSVLIGLKKIGLSLGNPSYNNWIDIWNRVLRSYNGGFTYPGTLRNNEKKVLPKPFLK